ncbi:MAG TPA: hypothetical protein VGG63_17430 [Steroidobacteraceae bacterium]|jgi:hypothetical protein
MTPTRYLLTIALALAWLPQRPAAATDTSAAPPAPPSAPSTDSLVLSANGSTLTDATGGGGGSLTWLHDFSSGVLGIGGEYQRLANAHWEFGSLSGSVSTGSTSAKWSFSGDAHVGTGEIGSQRFDYDIEGAGISGTFGGKLIVQLEDRQYDVYTTHGNMPKAGLSFLWNPHWQTSVSYARSITGNLGTEIETLRVDHYGHAVNWLLGAAAGHVAPPVVNVYTGLIGTAPRYREGYLGLSKSFAHSDWSILGDYLKVANERRITLTIVCTLHAD